MAERESRYRRSPRRSPDERRGHRMEDKRRRRRDSSEDARTRSRRERSRSPQSRRLVCFNWSSGASGCDIWPLHVEYKLNCTLKLWAEFCVLMSVDYAWTYLKRTQLLCVICTVCEQPALSVLVCSCHACVNFVPQVLMLHSGSSHSPMRQRAGHIACTKLPEDV